MKTHLVSFLTLLLIVIGVEGFAQDVKVNTEKSQLEWLAKKVTGQHNGTVNIKSGSLKFSNGTLTGGTFVLDMTTINDLDLTGTYKTKLTTHLESDDFFSVAKFPEASLVITKATPKNGEGSNYEITANLTIKGITNAITFPAYVDLKNGVAKASFTIDRTKWDIRYGSGSFFEGLGDKMIYDDIEYTVTLALVK